MDELNVGYHGDQPYLEHIGGGVVKSARKTHVCTVCKGLIYPKDRYWRVVYKLDGEFFFDKYHAACSPSAFY